MTKGIFYLSYVLSVLGIVFNTFSFFSDSLNDRYGDAAISLFFVALCLYNLLELNRRVKLGLK